MGTLSAVLQPTASSPLRRSCITAPTHLKAAELLLAQIRRQHAAGIYFDDDGCLLNRYQHECNVESSIRIGSPALGLRAMNHSDGPGFVTKLLRLTYGVKWGLQRFTFLDTRLRLSISSSRPQAYQYGLLAKQGVGFTEVPTLQLAMPGDILSWWCDESHDADHVMLIKQIHWTSLRAYPSRHMGADPSLASAQYVEVTVIDSCASGHSMDSRFTTLISQSCSAEGLGRGVIGLLLDAQTRVIGGTWTAPSPGSQMSPVGWVKRLHAGLNLQPHFKFAIGRPDPRMFD